MVAAMGLVLPPSSVDLRPPHSLWWQKKMSQNERLVTLWIVLWKKAAFSCGKQKAPGEIKGRCSATPLALNNLPADT